MVVHIKPIFMTSSTFVSLIFIKLKDKISGIKNKTKNKCSMVFIFGIFGLSHYIHNINLFFMVCVSAYRGY